MAFSAASPRCMACSVSNNVIPTPLPVSRSTSISIFAPSRPGCVSLDSTSRRTIAIASSMSAGNGGCGFSLMLLRHEAGVLVVSEVPRDEQVNDGQRGEDAAAEDRVPQQSGAVAEAEYPWRYDQPRTDGERTDAPVAPPVGTRQLLRGTGPNRRIETSGDQESAHHHAVEHCAACERCGHLMRRERGRRDEQPDAEHPHSDIDGAGHRSIPVQPA